MNKKIITLIKREVRERLMSKTFIYSTVALPVFMILLIAVQTYLFQVDSGNTKNLLVVSNSANLLSLLKNEFGNEKKLAEDGYKFTFKKIETSEIDSLVNANKRAVLKDKLTGIVFVPAKALKNKTVKYFSKAPNNFKLKARIGKPINKVLIENYFADKNLTPEDLAFVRKNLDIVGLKISKNKGISKAGYGNLILAYLFTFLLYISLLMTGQLTMQSVMEEKTSRIVEVVLSSVNAKELMIGKILGSAIIGVVQMAIWLSPVVLVISTTIFTLPPEITFDITISQVIYLLVNYFLGLITFLGLFAMMGSIFENTQDAQSGMWPIMILIIIPFFISLALIDNPNNAVANIASMAPFSSIIVMPTKMTLADVPLWKFLVSLVVNILTFLAIFPIAGKIYRVGILRTGKKPKWSEVVKWLKYKY